MCSENTEKVDKSEILNALKVWQDTGNLPKDDIVSHVVKACSEVSFLCDLVAMLRAEFLMFFRADSRAEGKTTRKRIAADGDFKQLERRDDKQLASGDAGS